MEDWIVLAALAFGLLALTVLMFKTRRRITQINTEADRFHRTGMEAGSVRHDMEQLLVDIESMCREITARIDTKMRVLNELIIQADERIKKLESTGKVDAQNKSELKNKEMIKKEVKEALPSTGPAIIETQEKVEAPPSPGEEENQSFDKDARFEKVFMLADSGADLVTIAKETGMPKGEIKLILGLRNRRNN